LPHSGFLYPDTWICLEGSVPSEGSFLSRFTLKFLEVLTAGFATAVSGFLIAHFSGYFAVPAPAPAVMEPAAIQDVQSGTQGAILVDPAAPAPATPPAASLINVAPAAVNAAPAAALHQSTPADELPSSEAKPHDAAETKQRDATKRASAQSFEARVRAALAKVGASYPASGDVPRRAALSPTDSAPRSPAAEPRPFDTPTGSIAGGPRPTDSAPRLAPGEPPPDAAAAPASQAPTIQNTGAQNSTVQLAPPEAVEIKSEPVAGVDTNQPAQADADSPGADQDGTFAAITKRLRSDKPVPEDQAPRPPMPVGQ
jgi:hypothetical protein